MKEDEFNHVMPLNDNEYPSIPSKDFHNRKSIKEKSALRLCHQNIQSLGTSLGELEKFITVNNIDILCITEHWKKEEQLQRIHVDQFKLVSFYCRNVSYGGSAIYCSQEIISNFIIEPINLSFISVTSHFEISGIIMKHKDTQHKIILFCFIELQIQISI